MDTQTPHQPDRHFHSPALGPVIDIIAGTSENDTPATVLWRWLRRLSIAGVCVVVGLIALRLVIALAIASQVSQTVTHGAQIAGLDASITAWLGSIASLGLGLGSVGLLVRALLGQLLPFGKLARGSWMPLAALIAASGIGAATPVVIKSMRGVDNDGLPVRMQEVDGGTRQWFNPAGEPLLWSARDADGTLRFYDRPGHRETDAMEVQPVTGALRQQWQQDQMKTARESKAQADLQRQQAESRARDEQRRQHEAAAHEALLERAEAERKAMLSKVEAERKIAEAAAEKARQERIAAEACLETQKREATDAAARLEQQKKEAAEAAARASAELIRAAQMRAVTDASSQGSPAPRAQVVEGSPTPARSEREIISDQAVRMVHASEAPYPWHRCNHCGQLPTSHAWFQGRMVCPAPSGCKHCGRPLFFHRYVRERVSGLIRERLACPH